MLHRKSLLTAFAAAALFTGLLLPAAAKKEKQWIWQDHFEAVKEKGGIREFRLKRNDLQVMLLRNPVAQTNPAGVHHRTPAAGGAAHGAAPSRQGAEIEAARNQIYASTIFDRDDGFTVARNFSEAVAIGDWTFYTDYLDNINKATAEDVRKMAEKYLTDDNL